MVLSVGEKQQGPWCRALPYHPELHVQWGGRPLLSSLRAQSKFTTEVQRVNIHLGRRSQYFSKKIKVKKKMSTT
jgi:hypothetical protein